MWAGVGYTGQEEGGVMGATGARAPGPTRARPPRHRHQKSADLDVLSGSSSDESGATEDDESSTQGFSRRYIPTFEGGINVGDDGVEEWQGCSKHVRSERSPAKPLKPPTPQGGGTSTSSPSPQSMDTRRISSSSFGTIVVEGRESCCATQDQAPATPLSNWFENNSGWELAGDGTGTTRERQALRAEHRRRQERVREETAVAAAAEVAAAGGGMNAVAAAAVAAGAAAAAGEGFGHSGPRARRQQQQQQQQQPPPRQPGKLRVKGSHGGRSGGNGGDGGEDADIDEESSGALAVAADGQRVRLSTDDFKKPVRRPLPGSFADSRAGLMPMLEAAAGGGARTCRPAERFAQTDEMEFLPPATGARSFGPLGESQLARRGDGGDEVKEGEGEFPSSNSFNYSTSSTSSRGRAPPPPPPPPPATGERKRSGTDRFRASSLQDTGSNISSFRTANLLNTGSSTSSAGRQQDSSERRRRKGLLGGLKNGVGVVWEKIAADHPEPLLIDKTLSKEEQKARHLQLEVRRRNDWQTNSMAEQHVLLSVLMLEEEKVTR